MKNREVCAAKEACGIIAELQGVASRALAARVADAPDEAARRFLAEVEGHVDFALEHSTDGLYELFIYNEDDKECE